MSIQSQILQLINNSANILLHLHPGPDADSVGSVLAFSQYLKQINQKHTIISGDSPLPQFLSFLPGFSQIKRQSYFDTNLSDYDLFISLDSADTSQISKQNQIVFPSHLKIINIDHHQTNPGYGNLNLIDPASPATCQILFYLFQAWKVDITADMAANLFLGIYADTLFKYPGTDTNTFQAATKLSKIYPEFPDLIFQLENQNQPQQITLTALLLSSVKTYLDNNLAIASVSQAKLQKHSIDPATSSLDVVNMLKSVQGWQIAAILTEDYNLSTKISLRTRNSSLYNVAQIAQELGGGGHPAAAGALVKLPLLQTRKLLLKTIKTLYPNLK